MLLSPHTCRPRRRRTGECTRRLRRVLPTHHPHVAGQRPVQRLVLATILSVLCATGASGTAAAGAGGAGAAPATARAVTAWFAEHGITGTGPAWWRTIAVAFAAAHDDVETGVAHSVDGMTATQAFAAARIAAARGMHRRAVALATHAIAADNTLNPERICGRATWETVAEIRDVAYSERIDMARRADEQLQPTAIALHGAACTRDPAEIARALRLLGHVLPVLRAHDDRERLYEAGRALAAGPAGDACATVDARYLPPLLELLRDARETEALCRIARASSSPLVAHYLVGCDPP